jgi:hypothetical protein
MVAHKVASRVVAPDCIPDGWHAWRASRFYFMEQRMKRASPTRQRLAALGLLGALADLSFA